MGTVSTTLPSDGQTIDSSDVNTPINAILAEFNGNIDDNNIKTGANINGSKLLDASVTGAKLDSTIQGGWVSGVLPAQSGTILNNGNRSYDIPFASTVADILTPGMRLRTTRTVTAPTQCADLESGSSQYFSSASPSGISFTTTFTCSAWVKLESYGAFGGIIGRRNADTEGWNLEVLSDGRINMVGLRIAGNNKGINSYQSIPLNKWVHVAACIDMTAGDTTAQKIWIDGVEVPRLYTLTGTASALVQGTTALVVGARKSDGSNPFDGKIAQASVHSACLSDAQIKAMMSQTIDSSSPSIVSGYTCNNTLLDVVTANNNDLTASGGALMTNADSPFTLDANGVPSGTTDYAIVTKVVTSTATVQVPEGCTIPTSGGVSAVAYSTQKAPYGMPISRGRWVVEAVYTAAVANPTAATTSYNNASARLTVPTGDFSLAYLGVLYTTDTAGTAGQTSTNLSLTSANLTPVTGKLTSNAFAIATGASTTGLMHKTYAEDSVNMSTATIVYANIYTENALDDARWAVPLAQVGGRTLTIYATPEGL